MTSRMLSGSVMIVRMLRIVMFELLDICLASEDAPFGRVVGNMVCRCIARAVAMSVQKRALTVQSSGYHAHIG